MNRAGLSFVKSRFRHLKPDSVKSWYGPQYFVFVEARKSESGKAFKCLHSALLLCSFGANQLLGSETEQKKQRSCWKRRLSQEAFKYASLCPSLSPVCCPTVPKEILSHGTH